MKNKLLQLLALLSLLLPVAFQVSSSMIVSAAEVTDYNNVVTMTVNGQEVDSSTTVANGTEILVKNNLTFSDDVTINEGDTLTLTLPSALTFYSTATFDILNSDGAVVGTGVVNPTDKTVTVTFTDVFSKIPLDKQMELIFSVKVDTSTITESGPISFNYGGVNYNLNYEADSGEIGDYEYKYGYQDSADPSLIHWKIIINAGQDTLKTPVITDNFGDGQVL